MDSANLELIANEISGKLGRILAVKVYLGIADSQGQLKYMDTELGQFKDFIETFVKNNFQYLRVGDHSLPLSGENILFFRLPRAMLILYSIKGRVGQLLTFKSMLPQYMNSFDMFMGNVELDLTPEIGKKVQPELEITPMVPIKPIEKINFLRRNMYYKEIHPKVAEKDKENIKFSLTANTILNNCYRENSLLGLFDKLELKEDEFISEFYKLFKANWIKIPDYEFYQISCPNCKKNYYYFVPTQLLTISPCGHIRLQIPSSLCEHTFYVIIDKKGEINKKSIPKVREIHNEIDFSDLSIENLIKFFGQDIFFNIYHALFFNKYVLFLESDNHAEQITEFMKNLFPQVVYRQEIQSLPREKYIRMSEWYVDFLVIDLNSNIVVNEPYEIEDFDYELRLFQKVLIEKDEKNQISKIHAELERLILTWEGIYPRIMRIGSDIFQIESLDEILTNTAEWLIRQNKLNKSHCPISTGHERYLLNKTPKHRNGENFIAPKQLSNGLFMEVHYSLEHIIKIARRLLEKFG